MKRNRDMSDILSVLIMIPRSYHMKRNRDMSDMLAGMHPNPSLAPPKGSTLPFWRPC